MFVQAFNYKKWADERTLNAIATIDKDAFLKSYRFTLQQINHMVIVEELFKSRLISTPAPHESTNTQVVPDLQELTTRLTESGAWYLNYVSSRESYSESIPFIFADGKPGNMTVEEILFHIVNHGSYHRGNIAHALDLASVPHPVDGYGLYIHEKEPERRQSL